MTTKIFTWSMASIVPMLICGSMVGGCSSDTAPSTGADSGNQSGTGGSSSGTGGSNTGTGGSNTGGAGPGSGGAATCSTAIGTTCDGPEDCPTGQRCCGKFVQPGYVQIGCFDSCAAQQGDAGFTMGGALWFELCHPNDTCEDTTATCGTSQYLPSSLSRCLPASLMGMAMNGTPDSTLGHDKNAVNCGKSVCTASEQCCIRQPLEPYCAARSATCDCKAPDAGAPPGDAGKPDAGRAKDAGTGGAPPKSDAATDAAKD